MDWKQTCHIVNKCHNKNLDLTNKERCETKSSLKYHLSNPSAKIEIDLSNVKHHDNLLLIMSIVTKCKSLHQDHGFSTHLIQIGNFLFHGTQYWYLFAIFKKSFNNLIVQVIKLMIVYQRLGIAQIYTLEISFWKSFSSKIYFILPIN